MKKLILDHLFVLISHLRKTEMLLLRNGDNANLEKVHGIKKQFSEFRDSLITSQLISASKENSESLIALTKINNELSDYLKLEKRADEKFSSILSNLPIVLNLLYTTII